MFRYDIKFHNGLIYDFYTFTPPYPPPHNPPSLAGFSVSVKYIDTFPTVLSIYSTVGFKQNSLNSSLSSFGYRQIFLCFGWIYFCFYFAFFSNVNFWFSFDPSIEEYTLRQFQFPSFKSSH